MPRGFRRLLGVLAMLLLLVAGGWWLWSSLAGPIELQPAESAPEATPIRMRDLEGRNFDLGELRGRVVVLTYWASWCAPCRVDVPRLNRIAEELGERGLVVLGLNADGLPAVKLERLREEWGIDYRIVMPRQRLAQTTFALKKRKEIYPTTWLIDREGRLRGRREGIIRESSLRSACERLLAE